MFEHYVYILESIDFPDRFYVGCTNDPVRLLNEHNEGKTIHTAKYKPWKMKNLFGFGDKQKAYAFEKYFKSHSGRAFAKKHF